MQKLGPNFFTVISQLLASFFSLPCGSFFPYSSQYLPPFIGNQENKNIPMVTKERTARKKLTINKKENGENFNGRKGNFHSIYSVVWYSIRILKNPYSNGSLCARHILLLGGKALAGFFDDCLAAVRHCVVVVVVVVVVVASQITVPTCMHACTPRSSIVPYPLPVSMAL